MGSSRGNSSIRSRKSTASNVGQNSTAENDVPPSHLNNPTRRKKSGFPGRRKALVPQASKGPQKTLVSDILKKRSHQYHSYDPSLTAGEDNKEIQILVRNEQMKGRLPNKKYEESKSDIDMKRAVALRNWEYLRLVAKSIGQQRRQHARRELQKLACETIRKKLELELAELALQEKLEKIEARRRTLILAQTEFIPSKPEDAHIDKQQQQQQPENGVNINERTPPPKRKMSSLNMKAIKMAQTPPTSQIILPLPRVRRVKSLNDIGTVVAVKERKKSFLPVAHRIRKISVALRKMDVPSSSKFTSQLTPESRDEDVTANNFTGTEKERSKSLFSIPLLGQLSGINEPSAASIAEELETDQTVSSPILKMRKQSVFQMLGKIMEPTAEQENEDLFEEETAESAVESIYDIGEGEKRSIFAAPRWDPNDPGSLLKIHRRLMKVPLVYSGVEKPIDVPDDFDPKRETLVNFNQKANNNGSNERTSSRRKFVFRAPAIVKKNPNVS
ncbi:uncharacterized protein LOC142339412 isoform X2 [Convolutriloba macropyga]|uniref:uncharacterized protein LOC142339412 isoform X2 n=1 Tax=Convolutriloba macropyga TaxID=536237 RepID=UPI003F52628C